MWKSEISFADSCINVILYSIRGLQA